MALVMQDFDKVHYQYGILNEVVLSFVVVVVAVVAVVVDILHYIAVVVDIVVHIELVIVDNYYRSHFFDSVIVEFDSLNF